MLGREQEGTRVLRGGLAATWDLPQPALPMTKTECLTCSSSSSCTTFSTKLSSACSFSSSMDCLMSWEGERVLTTGNCDGLGKTPETIQPPPEVLIGPLASGHCQGWDVSGAGAAPGLVPSQS